MPITIRESANKARRARIEEDCQDITCSDAKNALKGFSRDTEKNHECPLDRETLGRYTWSLLHTIAARYPEKPTKEVQNDMKEFIRIFSKFYPCSYCASEFRADLSKMPPEVDSRTSLAMWFCNIHNKTSERLNKPKFDCSKIDERWRTGWKDGSCN